MSESIKALIKLSQERGYITYAEINERVAEYDRDIIISSFLDMGWQVLDCAPGYPLNVQTDVSKKGRGISSALWDEFAIDFIETISVVMPHKTPTQINNALNILSKRLKDIQFSKAHLEAVTEYLDAWATNTRNHHKFERILNRLRSRIIKYTETLIQFDELSTSLGIA